MQSVGHLDVSTVRLMHRSRAQRLHSHRLHRHEQRQRVHRHILSHVQMHLQRAGQQVECGAGLRLDLVG